ncbi:MULTISPECIES: HAD hydrolase-like protein [Clostridium]|uniref:HAD hydrolase-like protein n=1 Tax=Clostridium TaxID=1485 RepID=UPI000824490B|nr:MULTISPECIES: HAD hydrolase-like protein [Clostridium]
MDKRKCFIDFDGTIVSNKIRLYKFFIDNIDEKYKNVLTIDEFWSLKRMGINEIDWLNKMYDSRLDKKKWNKLKKSKIESLDYLRYNKIFEFSRSSLEKLSKRFELILVTRRSNTENFLYEIKSLKIKDIFYDILILEHGDRNKSSIIQSKYKVNSNDIIIGDTEDDIKAAEELNIKGILVQSGIRSTWILNKYFKEYSKVACIKNLNFIFDEI